MNPEIPDYQKIKEIGKTSTGTTFLAKDPSNKLVALKVVNKFSKEVMKDLAAEQLLANLHPQFAKSSVIVKIKEKYKILKTNFQEKDLLSGKQNLEKWNTNVSFFLFEELTLVSDFELFFVREIKECGSITSILHNFVIKEETIRNISYQILLLLAQLHKKEMFMKYMDNKSVLIDKNGEVFFTNFYFKKSSLEEIRMSTLNKATSYFFLPSESLDVKYNLACQCQICKNEKSKEICKKKTEFYKSDVYSLGVMLLEMVYGDFNLLSDEYLKEIDLIILKSSFSFKEEKEFYPISQEVKVKNLKENYKEIAQKFMKGNICKDCKDSVEIKEDSLCSLICLKKEKEIMKEVTNTRTIKTKKNIPESLLEIISLCLCDEVTKRPSVNELLDHPYFKKEIKGEVIDFNFGQSEFGDFFKEVSEKFLRK